VNKTLESHIQRILREASEPLALADIEAILADTTPRRTLQARIKNLVENGVVCRVGSARATRYRLAFDENSTVDAQQESIPLSDAGRALRKFVRSPISARTPVGYDRSAIRSYRPNDFDLLSRLDRERLALLGTLGAEKQPAGTYTRNLYNRLLIDLSWNSSRLEGNTYSLLDTRRLIAFGEVAEGKDLREAQMILNHKDAIEFLITSAEHIGFNRYTLTNLHAILANNLLPDPDAPGRLRHISVGIHGSTYQPLEVPQLIEEEFDLICATATEIGDPFEQSLFILLYLPYLQPFDDVNKRVSRLAANIPMIKANLIPLSFMDVPQDLYTQAILSFYETRDPSLMRDVFLWAYRRSAALYGAVQQSLGNPDPFRITYREEIKALVGELIRNRVARGQVPSSIRNWTIERIAKEDRARFQVVIEDELIGVHAGNFARFRVTPSEFDTWRSVWGER